MLEDVSLEQFVTQQLQSGKYQSYEEMVQAGLRLLQAHEAELDRIADKLRPAVEEFLSGHPGVPFDAEEIIKHRRLSVTPNRSLPSACNNHRRTCAVSPTVTTAAITW